MCFLASVAAILFLDLLLPSIHYRVLLKALSASSGFVLSLVVILCWRGWFGKAETAGYHSWMMSSGQVRQVPILHRFFLAVQIVFFITLGSRDEVSVSASV